MCCQWLSNHDVLQHLAVSLAMVGHATQEDPCSMLTPLGWTKCTSCCAIMLSRIVSGHQIMSFILFSNINSFPLQLTPPTGSHPTCSRNLLPTRPLWRTGLLLLLKASASCSYSLLMNNRLMNPSLIIPCWQVVVILWHVLPVIVFNFLF